MRLFNKKSEPVVETSYDDVVTYLRDLEQADYTKIIKVVETYRDADKKVKKILGIKNTPDADPDDDIAAAFLDDDDDTTAGNFLEDELPTKEPKKPAKKVEVKDK